MIIKIHRKFLSWVYQNFARYLEKSWFFLPKSWFRMIWGLKSPQKAAPKPSETSVLRGKIMIFQDISRNFDTCMLNSENFIWIFMIIKLLETKNEPTLRVSRILEPRGLIQPVLDPLTCVNCLPAVYGSATRSRVDGKHDNVIVDTQRWCATATEYLSISRFKSWKIRKIVRPILINHQPHCLLFKNTPGFWQRARGTSRVLY